MPARIPMTAKQREALLALPMTEEEVIAHHSLDENERAAIARLRSPANQLGYALQLCCLRFPGRYLRRGELLPAIMLDHVAEQIDVDADVIADFAKRGPTRYEQLASIKRNHGFVDLTHPVRAELKQWLEAEALSCTDGRLRIERLIARMRERKIIIPGVSVIERLTASAMHAADAKVASEILAQLNTEQKAKLNAVLDDKTHAQQSRLSWLREPPIRVGARGLFELLDKIDYIRRLGIGELALPDYLKLRLSQLAREGVRYTAQALQQMTLPRRMATLVATIGELEATLTDAALAMFGSLVGRAHLRARKRLEETLLASADQGRERLVRIADVLGAMAKAIRKGDDVEAAVTAVASLDLIEADALLIKRTTKPGRPDATGELAPEYKIFKQVGSRFLRSFTFEGRRATAPLRTAIGLLIELDGNWRKALW